MADKRITDLNLHTSLQLSDIIPIVNTGETKKTTYGSLKEGIRAGLISGSSQIVFNDISSNPLTGTSNSILVEGNVEYYLPINSDNVYLGYSDVNNSYVWKELFLGERGINIDGTRISKNPTTNNIKFLDTSGNVLSAEVDYNTVFNKPALISGSSQIDITQTQNYGDVMITGSLSDGTITFTKGDSSTFDINLGSVFTKHAWISCYSTSSQALVSSGSAQSVTFTSIWTQHDVSLVSGSQITFAQAGTYEFNFVAQVENSDNAVHDSYFWIKYNGNNFPNSTTQVSLLPRKSSGESSTQLMNVSIIGVAQNDNDYIELYWTGDSTTISLAETPAFNGVPETPSIIASIKRIG